MRGGGIAAFSPAQLVDRDVQRPLRGHSRVLLAHAARSRVARVGEQPLRLATLADPLLIALRDSLIELLEALLGHEDLAAHLEAPRRVALQLVRYRANAADVRRHILAAAAVAARRGLHEPALLVDQRDREAVDLWFGHPGERLAVEQPRGAAVPLAQLIGVECVAQTEHRQRMLDHRERGLLDLRADLLGGAVGGHELGEALLELLQLAKQRVEVRVADFRVVVDEVAAVVMADEFAQLLDAIARVDPGAVTCRALYRSHQNRVYGRTDRAGSLESSWLTLTNLTALTAWANSTS